MSRLHALTAVMIVLAAAGGCQQRTDGAAERTLTETLAARADLTTLVDALEAAELAEMLRDEGPYTVFAPINRAFDKLPAGTLDSLMEPANRPRLGETLNDHIVPGKVMAIDLVGMRTLRTLAGDDLTVNVVNGKIHINGAVVIQTDVAATNGVIHVIDAVLLPPGD